MSVRQSAPKTTLSAASIQEMAAGFQTSRIVLTACELGIFSTLGGRCMSAAQVARILGSEARATDRLMRALSALGLLQVRHGTFSNAPAAARYMVKGKPDYMAGFHHLVNLWDSWSGLTQAIRHGKPAAAGPINSRRGQWLTAFIAAMHWRARRQAPAVVGLLDLRGVSRVLDVGAGSGAYAMAFVRARKGIQAVAFDLPKVVHLTRSYVSAERLEKNVKIIKGDYRRDNLGRGFDLVFLSAILHSNSPAQNQKLIRKCVKALNPGGQVVVQEFIMDETRTRPVFGAIFALNMLVGTDSGDTYTESEVRTWMEGSGLSRIKRQDVDPATSLIVGRLKGK